MENRVFFAGEDLDRIDVITSENISLQSEQLSLTGSRNFLTGNDTNFRQTSESPQECIELSTNNSISRRKSSLLNVTNVDSSRVPTPINMVRRWSQSISRYSKDKRSMREKTIYRMPSRSLFEVDGKIFISDREAELEQLVHEIEQHDYLMKTDPLSKQSRLETLRALPQPLSVKRLIKAQLSICVEQQHSNDLNHGPKKIIKFLFNTLLSVLIKVWKLLGITCNRFEIWYQAIKTIEGHFGSNVTSYFKFLRWLFATNLVLCIFPMGFMMIPQILYNDDVRRRSSRDNISLETYNERYRSNYESVDNISAIQNWSIMDLLTGEGMLKSSLLFYGSYTNVTFNYRSSKTTYSIPNAYYMTMLVLYLCFFVVISTSVAHSYRKSFIETSNGIRSLYASKIFFAWDYSIGDRRAADLKHFAIYTELKNILKELNGSKTKLTAWDRILIFCTQTVAHFLVGATTVGAGIAMWIFLKECGDIRAINSSWNSLYVAALTHSIVLSLQTVFSWISKMEDYRSPSHMLHITLARNFLLESAIIGVLAYYWITRSHFEGWETAIGQEIYRLIITGCFIDLFFLPIMSCLRVFVVARHFPKCGSPEFDISLKSLSLVFNQTLLWLGLFFAPLLASIMIVKMVLLFYVNKAMLMYLCKSPRHVWRSAHTTTLYILFSFLSLLGVIITLGYIMTQIPISQYSGPFRDQSYMFQIFIDGVLRLRQNRTVWSILMFLIRPAVVGGMLIVMSIMVYYLHAKSRAHVKMVKLLKEMIYEEVKDKEFLLTSITKITKNENWYSKSIGNGESAESIITANTKTWKNIRKRCANDQQKNSVINVESASSEVSTLAEDTLRNRNV